MPTITINGTPYECRERIPVLQAALESGLNVPYYCYHPGLAVVASCRLCLMEMQMPHPKTGEMSWAPKLFPSCQMPVSDGMVVRFDSKAVTENQRHVMEYFLLNHPLDCPVCDKAGECDLQDYSFAFGNPTSRMAEPKQVNPKKDIGPRTLLYSDRCVLCSRCVRFTQEISGTSELTVTRRGFKSEIDVFPGIPLNNDLQGNVVDICPVGALLDKDFLFKQRVWFLEGTSSVCPSCSTGCAIRVDHNKNTVYRLKPRYNPGVNDWWMCDEGRFNYKYIGSEQRIRAPKVRRGSEVQTAQWAGLTEQIRLRFEQRVQKRGPQSVAAVLSPFMTCEEAWLLASFIRAMSPEAMLALGFVPVTGEDKTFPAGAPAGKAKFTIHAEKCPNRRGVETVIQAKGGPTATAADFWIRAGKGEFAAVWIAGGYPTEWATKEIVKAAEKIDMIVLHDLLHSELADVAAVLLPSCPWAEREGSFMNFDGRLQVFQAALRPPQGCQRDGQILFELTGGHGLYAGQCVRESMSKEIPGFPAPSEPPAEPPYFH